MMLVQMIIVEFKCMQWRWVVVALLHCNLLTAINKLAMHHAEMFNMQTICPAEPNNHETW